MPPTHPRDPAPSPTQPDDDFRPWDQPGAIRRAWEPHRGGMIFHAGVASTVLGGLALGGSVFPFAGPVLAAAALAVEISPAVIGRRDLAEMDLNRRDPAGWLLTRQGMQCGWLAIALAALALLGS